MNYVPKRVWVNEPRVGEIVTVSIGGTMLRQSKHRNLDVLVLRTKVSVPPMSVATFTAGRYEKVGHDEKADYYEEGQLPDSGRIYVGKSVDPTSSIKVPKNSQTLCAVLSYGVTMCANDVPFMRETIPIYTSDSSLKSLIYNGRNGDNLIVAYREGAGSSENPARSNEIEYDLSETDIVSYQDARLRIIESDSLSVTYEVLARFP